jgi:hypothetical protein
LSLGLQSYLIKLKGKVQSQNLKLKNVDKDSISGKIFIFASKIALLTRPDNKGHKLNKSWLIKLMMIAPLAEPASMNARLKLLLKVISTKLILRFAQIVVLVPMFARLKQFTLSNRETNVEKPPDGVVFFC